MSTYNQYKSLLESVLSESTKSKLVWAKVANKLIHNLGGGESIEIAAAGNDYVLLHVKDGRTETVGFKQDRTPEGLMQQKMRAQRYMSQNGILPWTAERDREWGDVLVYRSGRGEDLVIVYSNSDAVLQSVKGNQRDTIDASGGGDSGVNELKEAGARYAQSNNLT